MELFRGTLVADTPLERIFLDEHHKYKTIVVITDGLANTNVSFKSSGFTSNPLEETMTGPRGIFDEMHAVYSITLESVTTGQSYQVHGE